MAWRVAKSLLRLREQINAMFPDRSKASDGTIGDERHKSRTSDHNAWVTDGNVGVVTAMDITHDIPHGCDAQALVDALVNSRDPRIKYIIWNRKKVNSKIQPWVWRNYTGPNPHTKHFHLSVRPEKSAYDSEEPWQI
jgi:hypothetical protein